MTLCIYVTGRRTSCSVMAVCKGSASPHRGVSFACAFACRPRCYMMFPDEAARIFSQAFYHALIAPKQTVKDAFHIAVNTVNIKAPTAAAKFLLLPSGERSGMKGLRFVFHAREPFRACVSSMREILPSPCRADRHVDSPF